MLPVYPVAQLAVSDQSYKTLMLDSMLLTLS